MLAARTSRTVYPVMAECFGQRIAASSSSTPVQIDMILNQQELWKHLDGDVVLLRELTVLFVDNYPAYLQAIRRALRQQDCAAVIAGALTIKGMVSNFGATEALEAAARLETLGHQGALPQAAETYLVLDHALERLDHALQELSTAC